MFNFYPLCIFKSLRSPPRPVNSPYPTSPIVKGLPSPAPLVFTPVPSRESRCLNCEAEMMPDHQCEASDSKEIVAEQKFSEFRMRWIKRLDKSTDDLALKAKLLETLEDAYLAPVSALSDRDLNAVKDQFFEVSFLQLNFWMSCKICWAKKLVIIHHLYCQIAAVLCSFSPIWVFSPIFGH